MQKTSKIALLKILMTLQWPLPQPPPMTLQCPLRQPPLITLQCPLPQPPLKMQIQHQVRRKQKCKKFHRRGNAATAHPTVKMTHSMKKLDWANSAPTYPQKGHHSRNMFSLGIFVMGPLLCDIILRENTINHLYKNLSNSIYNIFYFASKMVSPGDSYQSRNYTHKNFAQCKLYPQTLFRHINQPTNQPTNQPIN